ncbi:heme exporter protein CcmD [Vibrio sp. HA2012]|uniref:heme exporter protein CcmD n=1 Tax=Vibrio sp. HA2012 TaxID=1971595 RepID=UPI000C2C046F|nr:heme exporter protein CcmD [Vibrio sp. HA2012]PJC88240.1 heme exporter protein CcmD [Vibrio sp. HA2012]
MFFHSLHDLLTMGGYGGFVWGAFGVAITAMLILLGTSIGKRKRIMQTVRDKQNRQERLAAAEKLEDTL